MIGQSRDTYIVPDEVVEKFKPGGRYQMIIVASRRAHDLQKGATPLISDWKEHKWNVVALKEIEAGLIPVTYPHGFVEPEAKEEEEENA